MTKGSCAFVVIVGLGVIQSSVAIASTVNLAAVNMAKVERPNINWAAAINSYTSESKGILVRLRKLKGYDQVVRKMSLANVNDKSIADDLRTINAVSSLLRDKISSAGSPVMLPLENSRLINEMIASGSFTNKRATASYFGDLVSLQFQPGPYGYRAYFRLRDTKLSSVMISGSSIFYKIPLERKMKDLRRCEEMIDQAKKLTDAEFFKYLANYEQYIGAKDPDRNNFGEAEASVPCIFAGALIEVNILCDKNSYDCTVRKYARSIMSQLAFVGGSPPPAGGPIERLEKTLKSLEQDAAQAAKAKVAKLPAYHDPGDLVGGTGIGGGGGSVDDKIYGQILFPIRDITAAAVTVYYGKKAQPERGNVASYKWWKDNFCEARDANWVVTCPNPEAKGHAGQDLWSDKWTKNRRPQLLAATDGIAFRRFPAQPAVTITDIDVSNIDYVYRHVRPSDLTRNGISPSAPYRVSQGCALALVDQLQWVAKKGKLDDTDPAIGRKVYYDGTDFHLHFEVRVPTKWGFLNVSPYWTLVQSHRLLSIGAFKAPTNIAQRCPLKI